MGNPLVTIIVPVYNGEKFIADFINSMSIQTIQDYKIIFIDDASTDNCCKILMSIKDERITVFHNSINQGYADCVNMAYSHINSKYFMCINIDVKFDKCFLENLIKYIELDEDIDMVCPLAYKNKKKDIAFFNNIFYKQKKSISITTTGNIGFIDAKYHPKTKDLVEIFYHGVFLTKYDLVRNICGADKLFDEDYHIYCEDLYLCWKLRKYNFKVYVAPKVLYWHYCGSSRLDIDINRKATFHGTKNKIMTLMILHDYSVLLRILPLIFVSEIIYLLYEPKKILIKIKAYIWVLCNFRKIHQKHKKINRDKSNILEYMNCKVYEPLRGNFSVKFILDAINMCSCCYLKIMKVK